MGGGRGIDTWDPPLISHAGIGDGHDLPYTHRMTRTYEKVRYLPKGKGDRPTPTSAAQGVEDAFRILEGRWKLLILFHLFGGKVLRFSELERAIPAISQKMLIQQLRQMEVDGIVRRIVHPLVPPRVEYCRTTR